MRIEQLRWSPSGWDPRSPGDIAQKAQLCLLFGSTSILKDPGFLARAREAYPKARLLGCTTAGEICDTRVTDDTLVATAIELEHTRIELVQTPIEGPEASFTAGERVARLLPPEGLVHVFILSDGLAVNGSALVAGVSQHLPPRVTVTGGLSGDGDRFRETLVLADGEPRQGSVAALGLYGDRLRVGYASLGGWDSFGPERLITKSRGNVLFELDGKSALDLYKRYLGDAARGLPATGLLFPLSLRLGSSDTPVVRTILGVNEAEQSMTFAGDMPEKAYTRLMKANFDRLIDGAAGAARTSFEALNPSAPDLAILISCVGRKLVLKQRIEEEVEAVRDVVGARTVLAGFYSYGEISPFTPGARCELHNQTMTITTLSET